MIDFLKKLLGIVSPSKVMTCVHEWETVKTIRMGWDYSGFHFFVNEVRCKKCGAVRTDKFWDAARIEAATK